MKITVSRVLATLNTIEAQSRQLSDQELVALILSGDHEAFAVMCRKYERQLFQAAFRITGNATDAEDIVQEALFKVYQKLATFQFASSLSTWLTQIVINCALMELRRRKSRPRLLLDDCNENGVSFAERVPDSALDIEEGVFLKEQSRLLTVGIARLPPNLRIVMKSYRASDLTMSELAETHAITVAAIKSRVLRAKAKIKNFGQVISSTRPIQRMPNGQIWDSERSSNRQRSSGSATSSMSRRRG